MQEGLPADFMGAKAVEEPWEPPQPQQNRSPAAVIPAQCFQPQATFTPRRSGRHMCIHKLETTAPPGQKQPSSL